MSDLQSTCEAIGVQALELQRWQDDGGRCVEQVNAQQCYEQVGWQARQQAFMSLAAAWDPGELDETVR